MILHTQTSTRSDNRARHHNSEKEEDEEIMKNEEVQNIKKIMGLQHNKDYSNTSTLRYGRLMLMTDQVSSKSRVR